VFRSAPAARAPHRGQGARRAARRRLAPEGNARAGNRRAPHAPAWSEL